MTENNHAWVWILDRVQKLMHYLDMACFCCQLKCRAVLTVAWSMDIGTFFQKNSNYLQAAFFSSPLKICTPVAVPCRSIDLRTAIQEKLS